MRNKSFSFVLCIVVLITIMASYSRAVSFIDENISADSEAMLVAKCEMSDEIVERLAIATSDEVLSVVIRLHDDLDLNEVERVAMERAGVTSTQLAEYEMQINSQTNVGNSADQQIQMRETYDKIRVERTAILSEYYQKLSADFLDGMGLSDVKYESASRLMPWIRGLQLTKQQIYALANSGQVSYMDYYEEVAGEDLAGIRTTFE